MINTLQIQVLPEVASTPDLLKTTIAKQLDIPNPEIKHIEILKRSIDARQKTTKINLKVAVYIKEEFVQRVEDFPEYQDVNGKEEIIIIGAGPAGLFAALKLIENGKKPIYSFLYGGSFFDIGTPTRYRELNEIDQANLL